MFYRSILVLVVFVVILLVVAELWSVIEGSIDRGRLSSSDLKKILGFRGVQSKGVLERTELLELVNETGKLTQNELNSAKVYSSNEGKCNTTYVSVIPNEDLFNELIEDSKDSAWILMTIFPKSTTAFSDEHRKKLENVWCSIQSHYARFGVNMAVLDCGQLYNLCWDRGFHRSPFVLVLPRGRTKIKDSVDFFIFSYSNDIVKQDTVYIQKTVIKWLNQKIKHRVNQQFLSREDNLSKHIFSEFPVNFISIYSNSSRINRMPPTSISALSVKFTGRIHFWSGSIDNIPTVFIQQIVKVYPNWTVPGHFFITKNGLVYQYGMKNGQSLSYDALELFFRDLCPSINDIFLWNLFILNLLISFQLSTQRGSIAIRLGYFLWYFLICNLFDCSLFLFLISSLNIGEKLNAVSFLWQKIAISPISEHIRYLQLTQKLSWLMLGLVWCIFSVLLGLIMWKFTVVEEPTTSTDNDNVVNNRFIEPWDPEAGHQIALLNSLGIFNLNIQDQPPLYISKLLNWSFQVPQKLAYRVAHKYRHSNVAAKINSICDLNKTSSYEDSEISSDFSSNETPCTSIPESPNESKWPTGYIFTNLCSICQERYRQNEILCGLPCSHAFHDKCIKEWLIEYAKDNCPQCRWPAYKDKAF